MDNTQCDVIKIDDESRKKKKKKRGNAWKKINRVKWADNLKTDSANLANSRDSHHWLIDKTAQQSCHESLPDVFPSRVGGAFRWNVSGRGGVIIYIFNSLETTY